jgi:hypothetical protein
MLITKDRAFDLIALSRTTDNTVLSFILLWTAVEVQIGTGSARKSFCLNEIRSTEINDELKHLHNLRSECLKEGRLSKIDLFDELSLRYISRIAVCAPGPFREKLVRLHIENLKNGSIVGVSVHRP